MDLINQYEYYQRSLPDGRGICVTPLVGRRSRLHIGPDKGFMFDDEW